jgi:hypothetical protein
VLVEQGTYPANGLTVGSLDIGDIDGDGKPDLVFFAASAATALYAQRQTSAGQFAAPAAISFPADEFGDVAANRVTVSGGTVIASASSSRLVVSGGAGLQSLQTSGVAGDIRVRDLNGDGRADIAVVHSGALGVYYRNADGTFSAEQTLETYPTDSWIGAPALAFGDFDSDGKLDVAVASQAALLLFFQE